MVKHEHANFKLVGGVKYVRADTFYEIFSMEISVEINRKKLYNLTVVEVIQSTHMMAIFFQWYSLKFLLILKIYFIFRFLQEEDHYWCFTQFLTSLFSSIEYTCIRCT